LLGRSVDNLEKNILHQHQIQKFKSKLCQGHPTVTWQHTN